MQQLLMEYTNTCQAHSFYSFMLNQQKMLFFNPSWPCMGYPPIILQRAFFDILFQMDTYIHEEHAKNTEAHSNSANYLTTFENVMFNNPCQIIVENKGASLNDCNAFSFGLVKQGMVSLTLRYFQILQYNFFKFLQIVSNPGVVASFSDQSPSSTWTMKNLSADVTTNNLLNMLRTPNMEELSKNITNLTETSLKNLVFYLSIQKLFFVVHSYNLDILQ